MRDICYDYAETSRQNRELDDFPSSNRLHGKLFPMMKTYFKRFTTLTILGVPLIFFVIFFTWNIQELLRTKERTLIIIKPDGYAKNLKPIIYKRFTEELGLRLIQDQTVQRIPTETLYMHYCEHAEQDFFPSLVSFMQSGPVIVSLWEGPLGTIKSVRSMIGATNPAQAAPGTIRSAHGDSGQRNIIHASDSRESANREIRIWFNL